MKAVKTLYLLSMTLVILYTSSCWNYNNIGHASIYNVLKPKRNKKYYAQFYIGDKKIKTNTVIIINIYSRDFSTSEPSRSIYCQ